LQRPPPTERKDAGQAVGNPKTLFQRERVHIAASEFPRNQIDAGGRFNDAIGCKSKIVESNQTGLLHPAALPSEET
jgi:hypothetical protein